MYQMIPGNYYLAGDGSGYDKVECLSVNHVEDDIPYPCVKVRYVKDNGIDIWFESPGYSTGMYIEPLFKR